MRLFVPLLGYTQDEDFGVRWKAAVALGRIGDASVVPALMAALKDKDVAVYWEAAAEALRAISEREGVRILPDGRVERV